MVRVFSINWEKHSGIFDLKYLQVNQIQYNKYLHRCTFVLLKWTRASNKIKTRFCFWLWSFCCYFFKFNSIKIDVCSKVKEWYYLQCLIGLNKWMHWKLFRNFLIQSTKLLSKYCKISFDSDNVTLKWSII